MRTISLCMIVKNEEDVLARCLDTVKGIVDEIIVVDTGSTDMTREIASRYTERVYDFSWIDDFSAARNFSFSKASMDYCMWMDADDVLLDTDRKKLLELKNRLDVTPADLVMMKYNTAFDVHGNPTFSYYRERLMLRSRNFHWAGAVHECITPSGNILHEDIAVTHRKLKAGEAGRNLRILENQLAREGKLNPREQFYYARELTYHGRDEEAAQMLTVFLDGGQGWVENNISACSDLADCRFRQQKRREGYQALFRSFIYAPPRAEICCALGSRFLEDARYPEAIWWYELALTFTPQTESGGFIQLDCYGYLPCIQLCVCYDRIGRRERAREYNERAAGYKPGDPAVEYNRRYFAEN